MDRAIMQDTIKLKKIIEPLYGIKEMNMILNRFMEMLQDGSVRCSDKYFDFAGEGLFKTVFYLDETYRYVIKFVDEDNETEKEQEILRLAQKEGLGSYFLETSTFELESNLTIWSNMRKCRYIMVQPCVFLHEYNEDEADNEELFTRTDWCNDFINIYGPNEFSRLVDFVDKYKISDLNENNVAWKNDKWPVIIDWLSGLKPKAGWLTEGLQKEDV